MDSTLLAVALGAVIGLVMALIGDAGTGLIGVLALLARALDWVVN